MTPFPLSDPGTLPGPVLQVLVGVVGLLALASGTVRFLRWLRPEVDRTELALRCRTWWWIVGSFGLALLASRTTAILYFMGVSYLALREFLSLVPTRREDRQGLAWAYLTIPLQYYWVYREWYGLFIVFLPVYAFLLIPFRTLLAGRNDGFLRATGVLHWGLMTTVFSLSHLAFLLVLRPKADPTHWAGPGLVVFLVVLTELNDVAQFLWGRSAGRLPVVPGVSPRKTCAGLAGGVLTTSVLALALGPLLTPMDRVQSLVAGLMIGYGGFVGDVTFSALKRDMKVKDSGTALPGHGGILDRVDSLTFTAPIFFHYVYYHFVWHTFGVGPAR